MSAGSPDLMLLAVALLTHGRPPEVVPELTHSDASQSITVRSLRVPLAVDVHELHGVVHRGHLR